MPRLQDILFVLLALVLAAMLALRLEIAIAALVGAFACGALYLIAGMLPAREENFWSRLPTTVFLACVLASLVLILPATLGLDRPPMRMAVIVIAALIPLAAAGFEVLRTPAVTRGLRRCLGLR
jgi:hypothetical protein